jgi:hypothetical protein
VRTVLVPAVGHAVARTTAALGSFFARFGPRPAADRGSGWRGAADDALPPHGVHVHLQLADEASDADVGGAMTDNGEEEEGGAFAMSIARAPSRPAPVPRLPSPPPSDRAAPPAAAAAGAAAAAAAAMSAAQSADVLRRLRQLTAAVRAGVDADIQVTLVHCAP